VVVVFALNKKIINFYSSFAFLAGICVPVILLKIVESAVFGLGFGKIFVVVIAANLIGAFIFALFHYKKVTSDKHLM
jgi:hypothetical protein